MVTAAAAHVIWGLGRRKTSLARVRLSPGTGKITINDKPLDDYVRVERLRKTIQVPFEVSDTVGKYDVAVNCSGGGVSGQVGACMLGVSRALAKAVPDSAGALHRHGLLTRDSRMVERKKYGRRKARRGCQFSKR
jgi:small subunit ribosomal protein S9